MNDKTLEILRKNYFHALRPYGKEIDLSYILGLIGASLKNEVFNEKTVSWFENRIFLKTKHHNVSKGQIEFGLASELSLAHKKLFVDHLRQLGPWKKGPFSFFGVEIDAQWRSDIKWDRLHSTLDLDEIKGKKVADIGCHNGYFLWRLLEHDPEFILGIEPTLQHFLSFSLMKDFLISSPQNISYLPTNANILVRFEKFFDLVFCLGVLYHTKDPLGLMQICRNALAPKGKVIFDTLIYPSDSEVSFTPHKKYAGIGGVWHVPSEKVFFTWAQRTGFKKCTRLYLGEQTYDEQKQTDWCSQPGQTSFLSKDDLSQTCEGYLAPLRAYYLCEK